MRLSFLGNSYEACNTPAEPSDTSQTGTFLGNPFKLQANPASPPSQPATLKYRGVGHTAWLIQEMEREGLDPATQQQLLMRMHIKTLVDDYLSNVSAEQRLQFVERLLKAIQTLDTSQSPC